MFGRKHTVEVRTCHNCGKRFTGKKSGPVDRDYGAHLMFCDTINKHVSKSEDSLEKLAQQLLDMETKHKATLQNLGVYDQVEEMRQDMLVQQQARKKESFYVIEEEPS